MNRININNKLFNEFEKIFINNPKSKYDILCDYVLDYIKHKNDMLISYFNISFFCNKAIVFNVPMEIDTYIKENNINNPLIFNIVLFLIVNKHKKLDIESVIKNKAIYENIKYPNEIINYKLDAKKEKYINNHLKNYLSPKMCKTIEQKYDLYKKIYIMRYIFKYTSKEMINCFYNMIDFRTLESWLKSANWQYTLFEAQQLTVNKGYRNYNKIRNESRKTLIKNKLIGSKQELYIREQINITLSESLPTSEVITGLNNLSILHNGDEIDIPIIIINNNITYKIAIEVNGDYWHDNEERELKKAKLIQEKGYKLFYIWIADNTRNQREKYGEIDTQIENIIKEIKSLINNIK